MAEVIVVPSSSGDGKYEVAINEDAHGVRLVCNCQAGQFGKFCKHKFKVLCVAVGIESGDDLTGNISVVATAVTASGLPLLLQAVINSERALEDAKRIAARAKKNLERHLIEGA